MGESQPENLVHVVFDDASHRSTDGLPIKALGNLDFPAMARSAGYAKTYEFDELEELVLGLGEAMAQPGPVFVLVKVVRDEEPLPMPDRSMAEGWATVRRTLSPELGNEV